MSKSLEELLTKAAKSAGNQTALGVLLGLGPNAISDWKHGRRAISPARIAELARVAGEDEGKWIALISVEKTGHEGAKRWIQQLAGAALSIALLAPVVMESVHYVKLIIKLFLQKVAKYWYANRTTTTAALLAAG